VIRNPGQCDPDEIAELNHRLRTDTNLRLWLARVMDDVPSTLSLPRKESA
jgi:hypothetical protein